MNVIYRKISPSETTLYREKRLESLKISPERYYSKYEVEKDKPELSFENYIKLELKNAFIVGAFLESNLIGICGFIQNPKNFNEGAIIQMYVNPTYRKKNIGNQLLQSTINEAFKIKPIDKIILEVLKIENDSLAEFYTKFGFKIFNIKTSTINNQEFSFIQMELKK